MPKQSPMPATRQSASTSRDDNISIKNSKYAGYYATVLERLGKGAVLNFRDIYDETPSVYSPYVDREFKISYILLPIVLLGLVHTGR